MSHGLPYGRGSFALLPAAGLRGPCRMDQLVEHLPAAWQSIARQCAQRDLSGEFVIVTGPSRTSDIEKTLILGVHGPKRLVVMLVG